MRFTELEFSAITKIVIAVINADGRVEENEVRCMAKEALRFGFNDNDIENFITEANTMETSQAIAVIDSFDDEFCPCSTIAFWHIHVPLFERTNLISS